MTFKYGTTIREVRQHRDYSNEFEGMVNNILSNRIAIPIGSVKEDNHELLPAFCCYDKFGRMYTYYEDEGEEGGI